MARKKQDSGEVQAASLDPGEMLQGGLKDDFRGVITEAVYDRWDYDGNIDEPVLAARLTIEDPEEDEPVVQHWSAGSLDSFVPGTAPGEPCEDEDDNGPYAVRVGKRAQLNNNTNFAHLMSSIIDSGEASKKFMRSNLSLSLDCLVGLDAHWNRVPQKKRSGMVTDDDKTEGRRGRDVLVVTEVYGYNGAGKSAKAETKSKKVEAEDEEEDDLDSTIQGHVIEAITEAPGQKLKKAKVVGEVLKRMAGEKTKGKAVKRAAEADFLENGPWEYDSAKGILSLE